MNDFGKEKILSFIIIIKDHKKALKEHNGEIFAAVRDERHKVVKF